MAALGNGGRAQAPGRSVCLCALQVYLIAGSLISLLGWLANLPVLTDWFGMGIAIQPNTALAALLAGGALILLNARRPSAAAVLGGCAGLIGASALFEIVTGVDLGIDTLLMFDREWGQTGLMPPGRMGPMAATSWMLLGTALALTRLQPRWWTRRMLSSLALAAICISTLGLTGYLFGASALYSQPYTTALALQTATLILAAALALIMSLPESLPMRLFRDPGPGGILTRLALPVVVLVPILIGWAGLAGQKAGLYDVAFMSALRSLAEILLLTVLVWSTALALGRYARERAEAQRGLDFSRRRVADVIENINDAFVTLDREWRYSYVNSQAERLLGRPRGELLGAPCWELFPQAVGDVGWRELHRAATERVSVSFDEYLEPLQRWLAAKACPTVDGMLALYFEDITERKQAEAELALSRRRLEKELADSRLLQRVSTELILEHEPQRFYDSVVDATFQIMNASGASMHRLDPDRGDGGELQLIAWRGFTPRAVEFWDRVSMESTTSSGEALRTARRVVITDVQKCEFMAGTAAAEACEQIGIRAMQSTPLVSRRGTVIGMISTFWQTPHEPGERELRLLEILARQAADLIEHRRSEEAREQALRNERAARASAEQAARMKDEFLATLSHELRTPLNAVIGWSQLLRKDLLDPEKSRVAVEIIERNARLQAQLITDLLDISRITSGNMRLEIQAVDLATVVRAAIDSVLPAAAAKGVRIDPLLGRQSYVVNGDPARLQQVVWNLLSNAVKFTPRSGCVRVSIARRGPNVQVRVSDTGEGIAPEFLPHIFERFRQADATSSRPHTGLGLGLAIVKELVELHGGTVRAASEGRGTGATFVVELPLLVGRAEHTGPASAAESSAALQGLRVLVVDDEPDALAMIRRNLEDSGAAVVTAATADSALEQLASAPFDVLVSDIGLPGRDGYELVTEARGRGIEVPALALTAFAQPQDRHRAMSCGYQSHMAKPFDTGELLSTIASLAARTGGQHVEAH